MRNHNTRKLHAYGATAVSFLIVGNAAEAQIAYTDIDPDIERNFGALPSAYFLDIDDDGLTDFYFRVNFNTYGWFDSQAILAAPWFLDDDNGIAGEVYNLAGFLPVGMAYQLNSGDVIGSSDAFFQFNDVVSTYYYAIGALGVNPELPGQPNFWADDNLPHFVGLQFETAGAIHYGWVRLAVKPGYTGFVVYDYAWNTAPGEPIIAGAAGDACGTPAPITSGAITTESAKVKWSTIPEAVAYDVQYRAVGTLDWTTGNVPAPKTFRKLSGLDCNTNYEWQVRANCVDGSSSFSTVNEFSTLICKEEFQGEVATQPHIYSTGSLIYIEFDDEMFNNSQVSIFDITGKLVMQSNISSEFTVLKTNLLNGVYIVQIAASSEAVFTKKIALFSE